MTSLQGIVELVSKLNPSSWKQFEPTQSVEGTILLPRWKLEFGTNLNESLEQLGCSSLFKNANLSKVTLVFE